MADVDVQALREALYLALLVAAPPLLAALAAGTLMALVQSALRIEERALQTVPRIAAALLALALTGPSIGVEMVRFANAMLVAMPGVGRP